MKVPPIAEFRCQACKALIEIDRGSVTHVSQCDDCGALVCSKCMPPFTNTPCPVCTPK